jgi:putative membrane protein
MMMGHGGYAWGWNMSVFLSMFLSMLLPMLLIAGVIILVLKLRNNSKKIDSDPDPMTILKKRYAKGEITREEFNQIKAELQDD